MAVDKNFVVKHGLEVNTNLILANATTNQVGIGSTAPKFELDVAGGIGATNVYVSGVGTFANELNVGTDGSVLTVLGIGGSVGIGTAIPAYLLDIRSATSTGTTALYVRGDVQITGDLSVDDIAFDQANISSLNVTGFATIAQLGVIGLTTSRNLIISGISTLNGYVDINNSVDISNSLNVSGITTANGINVIGHAEFDDINVSGIATISQLDVQNDFDVYAVSSTFHNDVTITGDLIVNGTQTIISTQSLLVRDKDVVLGIGTTPGNETDDSANHGGIAIASTEGNPLVSLVVSGINTFPDTYKQMMWVAAETFGVGTTDAWLFNYAVGVGSTQVPNGVRFAAGPIQFTDNRINTPNINVSGVSTLGNIRISSGIITSTTGIVTYYGDGSKLTNILSGVGISSLGTLIGIGATILNFIGTAVSTITVSSGIATIKLDTGSGGGGTPGGSNGQVQYNNSGVFAGSSNFTFDGSNVNIAGVVTATTFSGSGASLTSLNANNISTGTLAIARGGTNGSATPTAGAVSYGTGTAYAFTLAGTSGQILRSAGTGAPTWSTATFPTTTTANEILYSSSTNTITGITTAVTAVLVSNNAAVPSFTSGTTANRVLRTDGTTVSFAQVALGSDVTGTLPIANGGTNATATPTAGGAAYGTGTAYAFTSAGTAGQVLTSNGTSAPTWQAASGGLTIVDDTTTNATRYIPFVSSTSGSVGIASVSSTKLQFNPSTGNFSATQFTSLSDASQKTNIKTIENPTEITKQLHGVRFDWIDNGKSSLGLIAQEVEKVLPELIETGGDGLKRVNYSNMIGLLIEAIKEQQVRIEELERKLNA